MAPPSKEPIWKLREYIGLLTRKKIYEPREATSYKKTQNKISFLKTNFENYFSLDLGLGFSLDLGLDFSLDHGLDFEKGLKQKSNKLQVQITSGFLNTILFTKYDVNSKLRFNPTKLLWRFAAEKSFETVIIPTVKKNFHFKRM